MEKGSRLRQASAQHTYNRTLEDAKLKLDEFEKNLQSSQVGSDLRHCKQLLKKHQVSIFVFGIFTSQVFFFLVVWFVRCFKS